MTFVEGEQTLSAWMALHARVAWIERLHPWELEDYLIGTVDLPLNLKGTSTTHSIRSHCRPSRRGRPSQIASRPPEPRSRRMTIPCEQCTPWDP